MSMVVRSGVPMVKIGDRVEVGTLLVSGEVPVYNDDETIRKYRETYADADIVIRRKENKEILLGKEGGFPYYTMVEEKIGVQIER